jgi:hypothetical protein
MNTFLKPPERSMVILKFLNRIGARLPLSRPKCRFRGETTMKPIPYRELDLQIRARPKRVSYRRIAFGGGTGQRLRALALPRLEFKSYRGFMAPSRA